MGLPVFPSFTLAVLISFICCLAGAAIGILLTRGRYRKTKFTKTGIITALSVAGIITLYFLFYAVSNMTGRSSLNAMWKKVEAAGLTVIPDEILPRSCARNEAGIIIADTREKSDNAVLLYKAALNLIENSDVPDKRFNIEWKCQGKNENRNAMPLENVPVYDIRNWPEKDRMKAVELSKNKDFQQALIFFQRGIRKPYAVNLRYHTDTDTDFQEILPLLNKYREIFRMISFVSECYAFEGKIDAAYELVRDGFEFVYKFRDEPFLVSHMVYIAYTWQNLRTLNALVPRYGISSQKARELIGTLDLLNFNKSVQKGFHGDLVLFASESFKKRISGNNSFWDENKTSFSWNCLYPFLYQEYAAYIDTWLKNYTLYDKPYWQIKSQFEELEKDKSRPSSFKSAYNYLFSFRPKVARTNSLIAATRIILALQIYKNEHGEFPAKLEMLTPAILKEIGVDPITGKELKYKKEGKYFKLSGFYSGEKRR
jgi:hypothetical protein